jgi:RNA polymerase sigma factor (sigma-70 family)
LNLSENEIVAGCVRNDRKCQEILYRRHFPAMIQMCLRYTNGDKERALEILNDGFLRIFKKIDTFEFKGSLEGWIRRLVFHAISDYFKQNQKYLDNIVFSEVLPEPKIAQNGRNTEGALSNLYYDDLVRNIEILPPATREVFRLYALEGFSHAEISAQLHISVGTSKWHLSTAREQLRKVVQEP